uniref:Uncharacterized protein n=1 Tax=Borely moumouvirus TaxID=2712067 RepID=A0A6G6AB36_9VIRU
MHNIRSDLNRNIRFPEGNVFHTILPTRGFKKLICYEKDGHKFEAIATLIIPSGSTIVRPKYADGKSRTDQAFVESIENLLDQQVSDDFICRSPTFGKMIYKVGSVVKPKKDLDTNVKEICTSGIHFFLDKKEAADYYY